jgi:hypothetical protein
MGTTELDRIPNRIQSMELSESAPTIPVHLRPLLETDFRSVMSVSDWVREHLGDVWPL